MGNKFINGYWDDYQLAAALRTVGPNQPTLVDFNGTGIFVYQFSTNDEGFFPELQLPHMWDLGTLRPHVHWTPSANIAAGSLTWSMDYVWANVEAGSAFSASDTLSTSFSDTATAYETQVSELGDLDLVGAKVSALLNVRLYLSANTTGQSPFLEAFDIHFRKARQGSISEFTLP